MGLFFRPRRPLLRLAAGATTATVAYQAGKRRSEQNAYNTQASAAYDATQSAAPAADPSINELQRLSDLHTQGQLTDEEFTAAKAKVLGI
jgi:hypothetical protein